MNIIFDFDGVILNSNHLKTQGFAIISKRFGTEASKCLIDYHIKNGGISRFKKIKWFVNKKLRINDDKLIENLIQEYGEVVNKKLLECEIRTDLFKLKNILSPSRWYIASGGLQREIVNFMDFKKLSILFEGGIHGSPTTKNKIIKNLKNKFDPQHQEKWVLIGDSKYDYKCSINNKIKFIFATDWTEINNYKSFVEENDLNYIKGIENLNREIIK